MVALGHLRQNIPKSRILDRVDPCQNREDLQSRCAAKFKKWLDRDVWRDRRQGLLSGTSKADLYGRHRRGAVRRLRGRKPSVRFARPKGRKRTFASVGRLAEFDPMRTS